MPTRKLPDSEFWKNNPPCRHPEHNPPNMRVYEPGTYEHTCPACGKITIFVVPPVPILQHVDQDTLENAVDRWRFVP